MVDQDGLVIITIAYHVRDLSLGRWLEAFTNHYHRGEGTTHSADTMCYVGLELVAGDAVDEGDVMLFFIGQHTGTGCEVLGRLVWHFDVVGDTGTLATDLH